MVLVTLLHGENVVNTLLPLCFIGSSFKQETKTTIKSRMSSKFGQILLRSAEFPRLIMGEML